MSALQDLADRLPPGAVSAAHADRLAVSADLWPRHMIRMHLGETQNLPDAVVWPESVEDVMVILQHARHEGLEVVPYGAGSSVVGGASPEAGQIVLDTKRLNRVLSIDGAAGIAHAQTGIMGEVWERILNREGLTQGHFPSSIYCSSLGGWIAARSAGQMSSRYGKIEDQVVGGTVVSADGTVLAQSPNPVRHPQLETMIGTEGTLGIWVDAAVRVFPLPARRIFRGFDFPDLKRALAASRQWLYAGMSPSVMRIYDPLDSFLHKTTHGPSVPRDRGPNKLAWVGAHFPRFTSYTVGVLAGSCRCILGLEGHPGLVEAELGEAIEIAQRFGAHDLGPEPGNHWYSRRYAISYRQSNAYRAGVAVDTMEVACPWERVLPVYHAVRKAALGAGAQVLAHFSHMYLEGASIYFTYAMRADMGVEGYQNLWRACLRAAMGEGANVSHHHGSGQLKASAGADALGGANATWSSVRERWDPRGVMNPKVLHDSAHEMGAYRVREPELPNDDDLVCIADPQETLGAVERRLRSRGHTLGACARLFEEETVLEAAKQNKLWRTNPQLHVVETAVMGVDAVVGEHPHVFVPAPRSAQGADLTRQLIQDAHVSRVWLRPTQLRHGVFGCYGPDVIKHAAKLCRDPLCRDIKLAVGTAFGEAQRGEAGTGWLEIAVSDGERGDLQRAEICRLLGLPYLQPLTTPTVPRVGFDPCLFVSGTWSAWKGARDVLKTFGGTLVLPWTDPVGAAGFVIPPPGTDPKRRAELQRELGGAQLTSDLSREQPSVSAVGRKHHVRSGKGHGEESGFLDVHDERAALSNCTYCPKLCRFSCPVAEADGNEALTPRQLMLTAELDRRKQKPLSPDTAARLWCCVDCKGCHSFCDHANDVPAVLRSVRRELVSANRAVPPEVAAVLESMRDTGLPPDRTPSHLVRDVVGTSGVDDAGVALWLGCQGSREDADPARRVVALVQRSYGDLYVVPNEVGCCGQPQWRWGDEPGFYRRAQTVSQALERFHTVVVDDPGCALLFREAYPAAGFRMPDVVTATSLLRGAGAHAPEQKWTVLDSCFGRQLGEPSLRELAGPGAAPGSILEGEGGCCGGMLAPLLNEELAQKTAEHCARDALGGGAERLYVSSPTCRRRLREAGIEVFDFASLFED